MELTDLLLRVADVFEAQRLRFVLIGGMAVAAWVEPRLTRDVDIVVLARKTDQRRLKTALLECGAQVTSLEMRLLFDRRFLRLPLEKHRLDVHVVATPLDRRVLNEAVTVDFSGRPIAVALPEHLVLYKLVAWRPHDRLDIARLLHDIPDLRIAYVESLLAVMSAEVGVDLRPRWEEVRRAPAP